MFDHSRKPPEGASARASSPPAAGRAAPTTALVQRRAGGEARGGGGTVDEVVGALPAGSGAGLLDDQRARFEASLGTDLSAVRVHTGPASAAAASELGARAFTTGNDIHFGAGEHRPDDPFGMHLLAHEVAHTVQQRGGAGGPQAKLAVSQPGDPLEREADRAADAMVDGGPAAVSVGAAASAATVQRRQGEGERAGERVDETRARGVESGNGELDRRTGGASAADDGSGEWGGEADDRGLTDHANRQMWFQVANAAEGMGLTNAARHMRHYLNNSGATLQVSVDSMLRDVESFRTAYDTELGEARAQADERIAAMGDVTSEQTFTLTGERRSTVYCSRAESDDWYFAVGGFTHWWTAEVTVTPSEGASAAPGPGPGASPAAPPAPSPSAPGPHRPRARAR
ncbi:MAG: DUF4157 domain-containing protein [Kofleriaceae bacterium]|nr:DUF4157 domain-containing protein [Kofleriaceae bacterium]